MKIWPNALICIGAFVSLLPLATKLSSWSQPLSPCFPMSCPSPGVYEDEQHQFLLEIKSHALFLGGIPLIILPGGQAHSPYLARFLGNGTIKFEDGDIINFQVREGRLIQLRKAFETSPSLGVTLFHDEILEQTRNLLGSLSNPQLDYAQQYEKLTEMMHPDIHEEVKFFFPADAVTIMIEDALIENVDHDLALRRKRMDRLSRIVQYVYLSSLPKRHYMELRHFSNGQAEHGKDDVNEHGSFGDRLWINGEPVMEAWQRPWMRALAENGLSKTTSRTPGAKISVLEIGWGQGLAGRAFLSNPNVEYTVIELHPGVADNARSVLRDLGSDGKVLQGSWEEILPNILDHSFDCVNSDIWDTTEVGGHKNYLARYQPGWFKNFGGNYLAMDMSLYRVMKPGASKMFYNTGMYTKFGTQWMHHVDTSYLTYLFWEVSYREMGPLRPDSDTIKVGKVSPHFRSYLLPCATK